MLGASIEKLRTVTCPGFCRHALGFCTAWLVLPAQPPLQRHWGGAERAWLDHAGVRSSGREERSGSSWCGSVKGVCESSFKDNSQL